ncbi:MAG: hypothetical protein K2J96_00595, partial [Bacteroidaceae bacterium]|nr:hypothetical protein [Bacteroidaceae bacterium]
IKEIFSNIRKYINKPKFPWDVAEEELAKISVDEMRELLLHSLSQGRSSMIAGIVMSGFLSVLSTFIFFNIVFLQSDDNIFIFIDIMMLILFFAAIPFIHDSIKGLKIINKVKAIHLCDESELRRGFDIMRSNFGNNRRLGIVYNGKKAWNKYGLLLVAILASMGMMGYLIFSLQYFSLGESIITFVVVALFLVNIFLRLSD